MSHSKLLTVTEIAHVLNVSTKTIEYWVSRKEIPSIKIGKHNRFSLEITLQFFADKHFKETGEKIKIDLYLKSLATADSLTTTKEKQEDEKNEATKSLNHIER